jgi:hypothetical protein
VTSNSVIRLIQKKLKVLDSSEFILGMVVWHDILFVVNTVSKKLQSSSMCIDTILHQIEDIRNYCGSYRNEGFAPSIATTKNIVSQMGMEPSIPLKHQGKRKRQFDEIEYKKKFYKLKRILKLITSWL